MSAILGSGDFKYEHILDWHKLPGDANLVEVPGVAVDSNHPSTQSNGTGGGGEWW